MKPSWPSWHPRHDLVDSGIWSPHVDALILDQRDLGFLVGLLVGEGSFGGDGKQPQITLRMHTRHRDLFERLVALVPGSKLYGPYHHGGRNYLQWMARGKVLRDGLAPALLDSIELMDGYTRERFESMCRTYGMTARGLGTDRESSVEP